MHHGDGYFWGMHFLWWIIGLFVLLIFLWSFKRTTSQGTKKDEALETLKKRFANGEITKEEYLETKKLLE